MPAKLAFAAEYIPYPYKKRMDEGSDLRPYVKIILIKISPF